MSEVGVHVMRARLSAGLTQAQLAQRIDISPSYLSALESGDRRFNEDLLVNVGAALGIRLSELLDEEEADVWQRGFEAGQASLRREIEALFASQPQGEEASDG